MEVFHQVSKLHCFDISQEMMNRAQKRIQLANDALHKISNLEERVFFHVVSTGHTIDLDQVAGHPLANSFDFIYS